MFCTPNRTGSKGFFCVYKYNLVKRQNICFKTTFFFPEQDFVVCILTSFVYTENTKSCSPVENSSAEAAACSDMLAVSGGVPGKVGGGGRHNGWGALRGTAIAR